MGTGLGFTFSSSFSRETLGPGCTDGNNSLLPFKLQFYRAFFLHGTGLGPVHLLSLYALPVGTAMCS